MDLTSAIAACLSLHATAIAKLGTDQPELDPRIDLTLREKIIRQRVKVTATLVTTDPAVHVAHVEALNRGLKIVLKKLIPTQPKPPRRRIPVWDEKTLKWVQP